MNQSQSLATWLELEENLSEDPVKYVQLVQTFREVIDSCFGLELHPGYQSCIDNFCTLYREIGGNFSVKVHILEEHVTEFLLYKGAKYGKL